MRSSADCLRACRGAAVAVLVVAAACGGLEAPAPDASDPDGSEAPSADALADDSAAASDDGVAEGAGALYYPYAPEDYGDGDCAPEAGAAERVLSFESPPQLCIDPAGTYLALFDTSRGPVLVLLDAANTPGTVNSFVNLARFGYYDGTLVHRSDPSIGILQGGSPHTDSADDPGPGYGLWDEGAGFSYRPGLLAMARTSDPNSADAQYFFTVTDAAGVLDGQGTYVVFGEVIDGLDVLGDILDSHVADPESGLGGAPDPPAVVNSVTIRTGADITGSLPGVPDSAAAGSDGASGSGVGAVYFPYGPEDYGEGDCAPEAGAAERVLSFESPPQLCVDPAGTYVALFDTSRGPVLVLLDAANTPGTVNSFVNLARFGYYDGTLVHRSDPSIGILQGGSPHTDSADDPGPGYGLWDEGAGFSYRPGLLAMARTSDPNSADAQYFFTVTDAAGVLGGQGTYVVFGEVIDGLDVLADILDSHVADPESGLGGAPDPPAVVNSVTIRTGADITGSLTATPGAASEGGADDDSAGDDGSGDDGETDDSEAESS